MREPRNKRSQPDSPRVAELVPLDEIGRALQAAVSELGLHLLAQGNGIVRIYGPPGTLDPYLLTEIWFGDGMFRVECAVPVLVPEARLDQVLELCLGLNTQGRVAFALGRRGTPIACHTLRLIAGPAGIATGLVSTALRITWEKASAAERLFRAVAAGDDPGSVLGSIGPHNDELFRALPITPRPRPFAGPQGTQWTGVLDQAQPWPAGVPVPEGHSTAEFRATTVVFPRLSDNTGPITGGCAGPLLFHADGVVECYGCEVPAGRAHLRGSTVSCSEGLYLGRGHRCERCRQAP